MIGLPGVVPESYTYIIPQQGTKVTIKICDMHYKLLLLALVHKHYNLTLQTKSGQPLSLTVSLPCFLYTLRPQSMSGIGRYGVSTFIAFSGIFHRVFAALVAMANARTP